MQNAHIHIVPYINAPEKGYILRSNKIPKIDSRCYVFFRGKTRTNCRESTYVCMILLFYITRKFKKKLALNNLLVYFWYFD